MRDVRLTIDEVRVLEAVEEIVGDADGPMPSTLQVARKSGLSRPVVSSSVAGLIARGILDVGGFSDNHSSPGRRGRWRFVRVLWPTPPAVVSPRGATGDMKRALRAALDLCPYGGPMDYEAIRRRACLGRDAFAAAVDALLAAGQWIWARPNRFRGKPDQAIDAVKTYRVSPMRDAG